jgi:valyl-tRNA synthetase
MDLVDRFGADAFRMGILRQMRLEGQEIRFQESRCEEARNFNNKIWNALRYITALPEGLPAAMTLPSPEALTPADRWILTRLHDAIVEVSGRLDAYDFGNAAEAVWRFIWYEFCDWYLEATKEPANVATRAAVLSFVMNYAMRLLHPIAPFVSEEVWLALPHDGVTIMTATWPDPNEVPVDRDAAALFDALREQVERLRNLRAELGVAPRQRVKLDVPENLPEQLAAVLAHLTFGDVNRVAASGGDAREALATTTIEAPREVVLQRLRKDQGRLRSEVDRGEKKLANPAFLEKAAPDVVSKDREKLERYRSELARVETALVSLGESP